MAKFAGIIVLVGVLVGAVLSAGPGRASYFRRYSQKRQAPFGGEGGGNCGVTITVGGGNGCNCACAPAEGEAPAPAPPSEAPVEWDRSTPEPPAPPPSGCGSQNPFCDNPFHPPASAPPPKPLPGGGQTSMGDEYCTHRVDCLVCGTKNSTECDEGDGNAERGQCFFKWSSDKFLAEHCQYHPVCNSHCRINRNEFNQEIFN